MEMKHRVLAIAALCLALAGCGTQKRAERHLRRAVALWPELVQMKAHHIDTVFTVNLEVDHCTLPLATMLTGATIQTHTEQGTFVAYIEHDSLEVSYEADPVEVVFQDTIQFQQIAPETPKKTHGTFWSTLAKIIFGFALCYSTFHHLIKHLNN